MHDLEGSSQKSAGNVKPRRKKEILLFFSNQYKFPALTLGSNLREEGREGGRVSQSGPPSFPSLGSEGRRKLFSVGSKSPLPLRFYLESKIVNGSRVGQIGPVDSCGQVGDLDLSLVNSHNLSRPVDSCGQVRNIDPSGSK